MNIFTVWNHKGGTGKTSLTSLFSIYLSETSRKVLMIDLDSQESLTAGFLPEDENRKTVYEWMIGKSKMKDCIVPVSDNLHIIPGSLLFSKIQNSINHSLIKKDLKSADYDFCFIDCPPTWTNSIISSITASGKILIPSLMSVYDLKSTKFTLNEILEMDTKAVSYVIFNRSKSVKKIEKELKDPLFNDAKILTFQTFASVNTAIKTRKLKGNIRTEIKNLLDKIEGTI